jgi:nicotinamidase-related amidase
MENNNQNTALLVMDMQNVTVNMVKESESLINSINKAIHHAKSNDMQVIYVVIGFRKGYPDSSQNQKLLFKSNPSMTLDTKESFKVHASVSKEEGDILVIKKRVSAFTGSDLEVVLRSLGIKHLVLTGIATSGVVLSTLREAADKDYTLTVLSDCCADRDEEIHRVLTTKVFVRQANVVTADEWCNSGKA